MVKVDVPWFRQPKNKPYCGPAAAKMLLAFYGIRMPLNRIVKRMQTSRKGVPLPAIGNFLIEEGFDVTIHIWLDEFPGGFCKLSEQKETNEKLLRWCRRRNCKAEEDLYAELICQFIEQGGVVVPRPVDFRKVRTSLSNNEPVIVNLNARTLYGWRKFYASHCVVVVGVDKKNVVINDSNSCSWRRGKEISYPLYLFMHACYSWRSAAIFAKPK